MFFSPLLDLMYMWIWILVDIHRLMKLHVTCYFTIKQHKSKYLL